MMAQERPNCKQPWPCIQREEKYQKQLKEINWIACFMLNPLFRLKWSLGFVLVERMGVWKGQIGHLSLMEIEVSKNAGKLGTFSILPLPPEEPALENGLFGARFQCMISFFSHPVYFAGKTGCITQECGAPVLPGKSKVDRISFPSPPWKNFCGCPW